MTESTRFDLRRGLWLMRDGKCDRVQIQLQAEDRPSHLHEIVDEFARDHNLILRRWTHRPTRAYWIVLTGIVPRGTLRTAEDGLSR